jgi:hypothetical protein
MAFDSEDSLFLDGNAASGKFGTLIRVWFDCTVRKERHLAPFRQQKRLVRRHRPSRDHAYAATVEFIAVTIRAVKDTSAPGFGYTLDLRQSVGDTCREQDATALVRCAVGMDLSQQFVSEFQLLLPGFRYGGKHVQGQAF